MTRSELLDLLLEDTEFAGLLVQQFYCTCDERQPIGDPVFIPRSHKYELCRAFDTADANQDCYMASPVYYAFKHVFPHMQSTEE